MTFLNTCGFFDPTGVGLFSTGYGNTFAVRSAGRTIVNIAGWIPGISVVAGIYSFIKAGQNAKHNAPAATAYISRGLLQVLQVGIVLAPFDIRLLSKLAF